MIGIHTALSCEAKSLVEYFKLKHRADCKANKIYHNKEIALIVSGIGSHNTAAAIGYAAGLYQSTTIKAWLNIGIAGHIELPVGRGVHVVKVTQASNNQFWYPPQVVVMPGHPVELLTVDQPLDDYPPEAVVDMEAAAFFDVATRFTAAELVQSYKIISDNTSTPVAAINAKMCQALITQHLEAIGNITNKLKSLAHHLPDHSIIEQTVGKFTDRLHFTVSQRHQLYNLVRRHASTSDSPLIPDPGETCSSAAAVIRHLEDQLSPLPQVP